MSNSYYTNVYSKRLNRYGNDFQSRLEGKRAEEFENFLLKSPNRVDFEFNGEMIAGVLEQYKQDYSETQGCLLTTKETKLPNGTVFTLTDKEGVEHNWMIWWLEQIKTSGYHRYVVLKMSHCLEWDDGENFYKQWGYLQSPGAKAIRDASVSGAAGALYKENNNLHLFITPYQKSFDRGVYIETENGEKISAFKIVEFDNQATQGVSYLSVDPIARKDKTPVVITGKEENEDLFWLNGGNV